MDEATEFLSTLVATAPDSPTACAGWTAHDLVAHLAAGAAEMAELTERAVVGQAPRPTRSFAARQAPFVAMADDELRDRLVVEAIRLGVAIEALGSTGPDATVAFSGRRLDASALTMHGRSEAALHRWDMAGDDEVSAALLAQPELTAHAVEVLNTMVDGSPESVAARTTSAAITDLRANFAAPGQCDVVLVVEGGRARLELDEPRLPFCAQADPATRLLALWGRRAPTHRVTWSGHTSTGALAAFLWGAGRGEMARSPGAAAATTATALSETR